MITEPFQGLAQAFAETFGAPGYHAVVVPHPVGSKDLAHLRSLAERVADVAARQLDGGAAR